MPRTSNKADMIMDYVNHFIQENGYAPSVREIGAAVGLRSTASVSYHLQQLQQKGLLQAPSGKGKKRAIVTSVRPGQIPVVGVVTAGMPILAIENQEGTMAWDGDPNCFALRVRGESMIGAGILDGDRVIVRPQQTAEDGQIVVARIGDEATVKRLSRKNGEIWLLPENPAFSPLTEQRQKSLASSRLWQENTNISGGELNCAYGADFAFLRNLPFPRISFSGVRYKLPFFSVFFLKTFAIIFAICYTICA